MKTQAECLSCFVRQAIQVTDATSAGQKKKREAVLAVAEMLHDFDMDKMPPEHAICVYKTLADILDNPDPYKILKKESNDFAIQLLPEVRRKVAESESQLLAAVRFSIAGNIIDYGAAEDFDADTLLESCLHLPLAVDHSSKMIEKIGGLKKGDKILYLLDNCGEIVYDTLLLDYLAECGADITLAVRGGAIINDVTMEEAKEVGLEKYGQIISSGLACPGTPMHLCSQELRESFEEAQLVISKGQGNFETMSEVASDKILFLLTLKCKTVGIHMHQLTGIEQNLLPGKGEMVIYYP